MGSSTNKISSLLLQYPDGHPLSSAQYDARSGKTTWQGWHPDGAPLGTFDSQTSQDTKLWLEQQSTLEQQIGLSFPYEFNLLLR
jgi:hypothetical protein